MDGCVKVVLLQFKVFYFGEMVGNLKFSKNKEV
jgi:hypothetical protein